MRPRSRLICPDGRSSRYACNRGLATGFATCGRRAATSAFYCATDAQYPVLPQRTAVLRRNSLEIVPGSRPIARAISRSPLARARNSAISPRSATDK